MLPAEMPHHGLDFLLRCWLRESQWRRKKPTSEAGRPCPTKFTSPEHGFLRVSITCPFDRLGKGRLGGKMEKWSPLQLIRRSSSSSV